MPEGNPGLDVGCGRTGIGVVPRRVAVDVVTHHHVVIARNPLPVASRVARAGAKILQADIAEWEIVVALDDNRAPALRQDCPIPGGPVTLAWEKPARRLDLEQAS